MRMRTRMRWWFFGGCWLSCHAGRCGFADRGCLCRGQGGEDGGHVLGPRVGGRWLGGPGRDLAARRADSVGSGGPGRRGAAVSAFWGRRGWAPAMRKGEWVGVRGGNISRGLHSGAGGVVPGVSGACAGVVCGSLGRLGVPWGLGLPAAALCGLLGAGGGGVFGRRVCGGRVWLFGRLGKARVAGPGAPRDGGRVWANEWGVGGGGAGAGVVWGGVELGSRVLCRCMCTLAAARLCGHLWARRFGREACCLLLPRQGFRR